MAASALQSIAVDLIDDHPDNPRISIREDVVDAIAVNLKESGEFLQKYAIHVRPVGDRFQVLAGHHRKRGAVKAGLKKLWAWVEDLDDDAAFMELALSNNQGELWPLELGLHALKAVPISKGGRGKKGGLSEYAERVGKTKQYLSQVRDGAEVVRSINGQVDLTVYHDKAQHLAAIHALPKACWPACAEWLAENDFPVVKIQERVKAAQAFLGDHGISDQWIKTYLKPENCAARVFCGARTTLFSTLSKLVSQVLDDLADHEDLAAQWMEWLLGNAGGDSWDVAKVQSKRVELDTIRLEREEAPQPETVSVLLADPPWQYDFAETDSRQIENQYPTATVPEICEHINAAWAPLLSEDAVLFLWATAPKLQEAMKVMEAWGFEYKTHAVWDKEKIGMGYWFRGQHELLLVGTMGEMSPPEQANRVSSVFREARGKHSQKPQCVYQFIEAAFPNAVKGEMYQRKARKGWSGFGNEAK